MPESADDDTDLAALVAGGSTSPPPPRPEPVEEVSEPAEEAVEPVEALAEPVPDEPEPVADEPEPVADVSPPEESPPPAADEPDDLVTARERARPAGTGSARYLPLPAARLVDQWHRFAESAEEGVGMLFVAARATPVHAISAGTVESAGDRQRLALRGEDGRLYIYGCLAAEDRPGRITVTAGDVVGELDGTGPRLRLPYLEVGIQEADGRWSNPYEVLLGLPDADELTMTAAEEGLAVDPDEAYRPPTVAPVAPTPPPQPVPAVEPEAEAQPVDKEPEPVEPAPVDDELEPEEPDAEVDDELEEPEPVAAAPEPVEEDDDDLLSLLVAPKDPPP